MFTAPINKKRRLSQFYILIKTDGVITHKNFIISLKKMSNQVRKEPSIKKEVIMPNDIQQNNIKKRKKNGIPVDNFLVKVFKDIEKKNNVKLTYFK